MDGANTNGRTEQEVLDAIEARRRRPRRKVLDERITLSHGAGGKASHDLVEGIFLREFSNELLDPLGDSALVGTGRDQLAFTTDSFVVRPLFFPGGDIGELAVNGTINDLAMTGATPLALSASFIVEEGLPVADLERIAASMARAAESADVRIATGDTKVVEHGKADGLYVNTSGVGVVEHEHILGPRAIRPGDQVIVSGPIGDHGMAVMIARGELELESEIRSDTAPLNGLVDVLLNDIPPGGASSASRPGAPGVRCLRDPTRGGLATVLAELALTAEVGITIHESELPIRPEVTGACEILGIDPIYVANEGKLIAIVAPDSAPAALAALRSHPLGREAAVIAEITPDPPGLVVLETAFGGSRVVDMLAGDPLPRIC
jgi:hydrogenase expression/formation protein HypE